MPPTPPPPTRVSGCKPLLNASGNADLNLNIPSNTTLWMLLVIPWVLGPVLAFALQEREALGTDCSCSLTVDLRECLPVPVKVDEEGWQDCLLWTCSS